MAFEQLSQLTSRLFSLLVYHLLGEELQSPQLFSHLILPEPETISTILCADKPNVTDRIRQTPVLVWGISGESMINQRAAEVKT